MTTRRALVAILLLGTAARLIVAARGHNFDLESYRIVGEIAARGGNVYNETSRYNYGPIWFLVLGLLYRVTLGIGLGFLWFRFAVTSLLTAVDIAIALTLERRFGRRAACLFFLNPISILITGYHSQFDNLAVLLGLLAACLLLPRERLPGVTRAEVGGLLLIGLSLSVKHVLLLMSLWVAMRKPDLRSRLIVLFAPPLVFLFSFAPFWASSQQGIVENVFRYRSFANAPLLRSLTGLRIGFTAATAFLVVLLVVSGFALRGLPLDRAVLAYTVLTVAAAPAIANQYLAICIPAVAVFFNPPFALYSAYGAAYLLRDGDGLHMARVPELFDRAGDRAYRVLVLMLAGGVLWELATGLRKRWNSDQLPSKSEPSRR